ncbi:uncharacterized protein MAM_07233 [Metarhizium album ARSEF 1941]|uniref:Uncharacterized protein n=1 Tax=Metarhizium album (strain ARSEF 1941) TaxID=1081103 RepID=A0A0B2WMC9_METAS|nr:uncharacterized protein MAM_07233 [Metarhizium album ARSEF 1941]KHN94814.1 hypothetical protein MAM_07233 [Metarhizium album ARSEF 1941]
MGLPLFVEPVKLDLANKTSIKTGATSPPRSDSRRLSRSEIRDRRNGIRRAGVRIYSSAQRTVSRSARERFLPWVEASSLSRAQDPTEAAGADRRSGMFRGVLREMSGSDERRRERLEERMSSLFNPTSGSAPPEHENMSEGVDLGWWSAIDGHRLTHVRRSRAVGCFPENVPILASVNQSLSRPQQAPHSQMNRVADGPRFLPPRRSHPRQNQESTTARSGDLSPLDPHTVRSLNARQMMPMRGGALGMDGLGDRERSLSPEGWDTLLSTLTPDPQPPSAGSSFASLAASQTAGPSSGTPTSAPDTTGETLLDAPCESGCENSDLEIDDPDYEHPDFAGIRRSRQDMRDLELTRANRVALNTGDHRMEIAGHLTPGSRITRQINTANGPLTIYERQGQAIEPTRPPRPTNNISQSAWFGQFSVEAPGQEDVSPEGPGQNPEDANLPTLANPMASEDDWAGMQRIVRSLARREDIPDEWWADAGLSRTLGQEESITTSSGTLRQNI